MPAIPLSFNAATIPASKGGWWHHYVCGVHGTELSHPSADASSFPPRGAACKYGCLVDTPAVRGGWTTLAHQARARQLRELSQAWAIGIEVDRASVVAGLAAYAALYERLDTRQEHADAAAWMLKGRLFHQALTDAIWSCAIANSVLSLATGPKGDTTDLAGLEGFLSSLADAAFGARTTLVAEGRFTSNYTAWLNAAGVLAEKAAAAVRGEEWRDSRGWLGGDLGQYAHIEAASDHDGWEWEGTPYYHQFVVRAYLLSLRGLDPALLPERVSRRLIAMLDVVADLACRDGRVPALHDGPYRRHLLGLEWLELATLGDQFARPARLAGVAEAATIEAGALLDSMAATATRWFAGNPLERQQPARVESRTRVYSGVGYGIVEADGLRAIVDYGPHGGSHGHHDKLALYLYGDRDDFQPDQGQVPYAHKAWRRHYASVQSHPTVRIGTYEPPECAGVLIRADEGGLCVGVGLDGSWYPEARALRRVTSHGRWLSDIVVTETIAPAAATLAWRPGVQLEVATDGTAASATWRGAATAMQSWHVAASDDELPLAQATVGPGLADDPGRPLPRLDFGTVRATRTVWASILTTAEMQVADLTVNLAAGVVTAVIDGAPVLLPIPTAGDR